MKSRPTQFGARENTASPRQHAPRFAENARSNAICIKEENSEVAEDSLLADALAEGSKSRLHAASQHAATGGEGDRKSTRLNSSHANISYAVFCLKKKKK